MKTSTGANLVSCWFINKSAAKTCINPSPERSIPTYFDAAETSLQPNFGPQKIVLLNRSAGCPEMLQRADDRTLSLYNTEFLIGSGQNPEQYVEEVGNKVAGKPDPK
jgi:hypothetical protein